MTFANRHIAPQKEDRQAMLESLGFQNLDDFISKVIPESIRTKKELDLPDAIDEYEYTKEIQKLANQNKVYKSYIGLGYYNCIIPAVIQRNLFENPGWYTPYTPYQSEISQGRLELLFHFQTMVIELTGMEIANASLLDEATAAAEAMTMLYRLRSRSDIKANKNVFFVSKHCLPQTIEVLYTRAEPLNIKIEIGDEEEWETDLQCFGALLQYPNANGLVKDYRDFIEKLKSKDIKIVMASDLLALALIESPGKLGVDIVVGSTQRFGIPMGYGGPHAAYFATREVYQRALPGRLVGLSRDRLGNKAYRLALQTREQHIRKDKATSNICTAQALLAMMATAYVIYHGAGGLKKIASRVHSLTQILSQSLEDLGLVQKNKYYFDTLHILCDKIDELKKLALAKEINLGYISNTEVCISLDETTTEADINTLISIFSEFLGKSPVALKISEEKNINLPPNLLRLETNFLSQEVFQKYRSETSLMRYLRHLEGKDWGLNQLMIPLGSCTMKLNSAISMMPLSIESFANIHPFAPKEQCLGYANIIENLGKYLVEITGMNAISFQPNSGSQGEFAGLLLIRAYFQDRNEGQKNIALIPTSAHGTNPASASIAGMEIVLIKCDEHGNIDLDDLKEKISYWEDRLACLMLTYPSTHGVFEDGVRELCDLVHSKDAFVYLDGANMNAQVALCRPGDIGADVCHLNLHKTFSIPHGGGGPGMGPICVNEKLMPYLPSHIFEKEERKKAIRAVAASPQSSASILLISYAYIRLLGKSGLKLATQNAILSANYLKNKLEKDYDILYTNKNNWVAHEMILDLRSFKKYGIEVEDVAKRLIDYGFHAPTMSWPVPGSLMIEPTESEPKEELDRFYEAMKEIRREIEEVAGGVYEKENNVLVHSPHSISELSQDEWTYPYSRKKASATNESNMQFKLWPSVSRIDNVYGDRNLVCSCPPVLDYLTKSN